MRLGDIIVARNRHWTAGKHFIIYLDGDGKKLLIGGVLTHAPANNVAMKEIHFQPSDKNGVRYKFQFDKTYVVRGRFIKPPKWGPYKKVGELTPAGIEFVLSIVQSEPEMCWDGFVARNAYLKAS